jgi:hypothetical protein
MGFDMIRETPPNGMYWSDKDLDNKLKELTSNSTYTSQATSYNNPTGKNSAVQNIVNQLNTTDKDKLPPIKTDYTSGSTPSVSMPQVSPRPFSPISLKSKNIDLSGLLNSPLLNKGLIK